MTPEPDFVPVYITMGSPESDDLELRFPAPYAEEIQALLDEHRITHAPIIEMSGGAELWIEGVKVLGETGGLVALAHMFRSFLQRHNGKQFKLESDGKALEASGYSYHDIERLLQKLSAQQSDRDADWARFREEQKEQDEE